jgi:C_GCAxxG_C_C family probable redox protein
MELEFEKNERSQKAMAYFKQGYNCSQAVFLAFSDLYDMDEKLAARLSSSFGGGMGRLREVCGAVSGMFMVAGALYGYDSPDCGQEKTDHYARIQELAKNFSDENGSIVCRELLGGLVGQAGPQAEQRTDEYYKKRPCVQLVGMATAIIDKYIKDNEDIMLIK